jgi:hypothetical protein
MSQGKRWDKEKVLEVLRPFFELDYSVNKACDFAGIPSPTVHTWILDDEELRLKIQAWRGSGACAARKVILTEIKKGNREDSKWWLERREKNDFSTKTEQESNVNERRILEIVDYTPDEDTTTIDEEAEGGMAVSN